MGSSTVRRYSCNVLPKAHAVLGGRECSKGQRSQHEPISPGSFGPSATCNVFNKRDVFGCDNELIKMVSEHHECVRSMVESWLTFIK